MQPGTIIADKFRVERVIGKGGMGTVVVATHLQLEQRVALKFLNDQLANQPAIVERFLREARSSARLRSEYVCKVLDVAQLDTGAPYIVMECLEGEDLGRLVARAPLSVATAADYVVQACVAVAEAHALGIVHRDLKPANLFLTTRVDGTPLIKVLDFGIAKAPESEARITQTSSLMGSPAYMSPEQLRSAKDVDVRSDVWSLGVILYELVSGRLPFPGDSITEVAVKVSVDPAVPLDVDPAFDAVVMRAIEKDIAKRYQSVSELATALVPFGGAQARALATVIGKLLGGSRSAIEEVSRPAPAPPAPDPRGFQATLPSGERDRETKATTLGGAASSHELPVAPKRSRRALVVGLGVVGALAVGGGVFAVMHGGGDGAPAKAPVLAATPPPAIDAAPAVANAAIDAAVDDSLANDRREIIELSTRHQWAEILAVGVGSDDKVVGAYIVEAENHVKTNRGLHGGRAQQARLQARERDRGDGQRSEAQRAHGHRVRGQVDGDEAAAASTQGRQRQWQRQRQRQWQRQRGARGRGQDDEGRDQGHQRRGAREARDRQLRGRGREGQGRPQGPPRQRPVVGDRRRGRVRAGARRGGERRVHALPEDGAPADLRRLPEDLRGASDHADRAAVRGAPRADARAAAPQAHAPLTRRSACRSRARATSARSPGLRIMRGILVCAVLATACWTGEAAKVPGTTPAPPSLETRAAGGGAHPTGASYLDITSPPSVPTSIALLGVTSGGPATDALTATFEHALRARLRTDRARFQLDAGTAPPKPACAAQAISCLQHAVDESGATLALAGSVSQMSWERTLTFELRLFRARATAPERLAKITVAPGERLDDAAGRAYAEVARTSAFYAISANVTDAVVKVDGEIKAWVVDGHAKILVLDNATHVVEVIAPGHRHAVRAIRAAPGETRVDAVLAKVP